MGDGMKSLYEQAKNHVDNIKSLYNDAKSRLEDGFKEVNGQVKEGVKQGLRTIVKGEAEKAATGAGEDAGEAVADGIETGVELTADAAGDIVAPEVVAAVNAFKAAVEGIGALVELIAAKIQEDKVHKWKRRLSLMLEMHIMEKTHCTHVPKNGSFRVLAEAPEHHEIHI